MPDSYAKKFANLPRDVQQDLLSRLSPQALAELSVFWPFLARENQRLPEGTDWNHWLILAGRGFGKTRTGAETSLLWAMNNPGCRIAYVGPTAADVRDTMITGDSGLLFCADNAKISAKYQPSNRIVRFENGSLIKTFSAEEPERLRGPQHHCFIAGTLIETDRGERPVETLNQGDKVWTRQGLRPIAKVLSRSTELAKLELSNGTTLVGSLDHPFYTGRGWVPLQYLRDDDNVYVCSDGDKISKGTLLPTHNAVRYTGIDGYGNKNLDQSLMDTISTTKTIKKETIDSKILKQFPLQSTESSIDIKDQQLVKTVERTFTLSERVECLNTVQAPVEVELQNGIGQNPRENASGVEKYSQAALVPIAVRHVSILGVVGKVYNLTVQEIPEYFANGVLVHNCYWVDELCAMPRAQEMWDMLMMGFRLGQHPQGVITTTPKSTELLRELIKDPSVVVTRGSTYENSDNLAPAFREMLKKKYEGTRIGQQELYAEILEDASGALWNREMLANCRQDSSPDSMFICIGVDPAVSSTDKSDLTGIIVCGMSDQKFYVLEDLSGRYKPAEWSALLKATVAKYKADLIVAEVNQGGDMVKELLVQEWGTEDIPFQAVRASQGKRARAEPISMLYEQNKVFHVGDLEFLEIELCTWDPLESNFSPDRLDALVWALTELHKRCNLYTDIVINPHTGRKSSPWQRI